MIPTILIVCLAFTWLLIETNCLRVRLLIGKEKPPKYARYVALNGLTKKQGNWTHLKDGNNYPEGYTPNGEPEYKVILNLGIDNILCGWEWLDKHVADMVDYQPNLEMNLGGVRYKITVKQPDILTKVMKANKLNKEQKLLYAN